MKKIIFVFLIMINGVLFSNTNYQFTNIIQISNNVYSFGNETLESNYNYYYNQLENFTNYWRDWATRYLIIMNENPNLMMFPYVKTTIKNDKSYKITEIYDRFTVKYDYGKHGFDELNYITDPVVKVEYEGDLAIRDFITPPLLNIYLGTSFIYNQHISNVMNVANIGYCFKFGKNWLRNITFVPSFGFNISENYYDIFFHIGYNIYNQLNLGIGLSFLHQNMGLMLGVNI